MKQSLPSGFPVGLLARFVAMVDAPSARACWRWKGYRNPTSGYGQITLNQMEQLAFGQRVITAPALACALVHGRRPPGKQVLHSCDERDCCNPVHLRWGTQAENNHEAWTRGNQRWGEEHPQAKVDDETVRKAVGRVRSGETATAVAADMGLNHSSLCYWVRGKGRGRVVS